MRAVHGFIHLAHICGGNLAFEGVQGGLDLGPAAQGVVANERYSLVRREIVLVIL
jgi:hypothetical protein